MSHLLIIYIFALLVLGTLLIGMSLQKNSRDISAKKLINLIYSVIGFLIVNCICDVLETIRKFERITFIVNLLAFLLIDITIISFSLYLSSLLKKTDKKSSKSVLIPIITSMARMAIVLVLTFSGKIFAIENGVYVEKELSFVPYVISGIIMLELLAVAIINRKSFSVRQFTVIILYLVLPVPAIVLELYINNYSLTGAAITLSILLVYALIQAVTIEDGRYREMVLEELSLTDLLTNLNNRRAYYNKLSKIESEKNAGVLFCDINGLKTTNDKFGHTAGDVMIKNFAELLSGEFCHDEIFRISGDEFVVILENIDKTFFQKRVKLFRQNIQNNNSISAVGTAFGSGRIIEDLVIEAEKEMYKDKKRHHSLATIEG